MQQITLDYFKPHYSINQPVRLIELFAGIGSQAKALQKLGVDFEKWVISEWEANATKSYKAIHCENDNTDYSKGINQKELINALFSMGISNDGKEPMTLKQIARKNEKWLRETYNAYKATHNISNLMLAAGKDLNIVDVEKYVYILTYSFPCQDLSIAGKQAGMKKGSKTRSGLLWEVERLLKECENLPQVLLMENVTQVHNKKNFADFKKWVECLKDLGYSNYYADLNAKDYGVTQNRNRCFMVSVLGDYYYQFPEPFKLQKRLKDILETDVDEKYYLSLKAKEYITNPKRMANNFTNINSDIAIPITAKGQNNWTGSFIADDQLNLVGNINPSGNGIGGNVYHANGISPTITAGHNMGANICEEVIGSTQKNAYRGSLDGPCPALTTAMGASGGNIPMIKQVAQLYPNSGNPQAGRIYDADGLCCSIDTAQGGNRMPKIIDDGDSIDIAYPNSTTRRGRHIKGMAHTITSKNNSQVVVVDDTYKSREKRKYDDVCPAIRSGRSGFKVQTEPCIAASRGRNPDNPNDRTAGIELEQRLEIKTDGLSNTLTTIQKDNLVVEPMALDEQNGYIRTDGCVGTVMTDGSSPKHNNRIIEPVCINSKDETRKQPSLSDRIYKSEAISTAITTSQFFMPNYMLDTFKVRKLTPKECLRLMTFDDADYEKIKAAGISDSAIYKQAGNSIVVNVMVFIFAMLFDIKVNFYEV